MSSDPAAVGDRSLRALPGRRDHLDELYAANVWRAEELGVRAPRGKGPVNFSGIAQPSAGPVSAWPSTPRLPP